MNSRMQRMLPVLLGALLVTACGAASQLNDALGAVLAPPENAESQVSGEITNVDTRNQVLEIRTTDGRTGQVRYDTNTKVTYQQQQYGVNALERGDLVSMRLQTVNNNELYTSEIVVTQSVQDRTGTSTSTGSSTALQRLEGTVGVIDTTRGTFELRNSGNTVLVTLGYNASSTVRNRYNQMRSGDSVRIEGRWIGQNTLQLERFY